MKFFKYALVAVAGAMTLGFTACNDDDDYQWGAEGKGVYFPSSQPTTVSLETTSTGFEVQVNRSGVEEAASYAIAGQVTASGVELTAEENPFKIPATVAFADGQTSTTMTIAVDASELVTSQPYEITLTFGSAAPLFNYGPSALTFTVTREPAYGPWEPYGDGLATWEYTQGFFAGDLPDVDPDLDLYIRHNTEHPELHQFWLQHWAFDTDLIIDWNSETNYAQIEPQPVGANINVTGLGVVPCYIATIGALSPTEGNLSASTFDPQTGEFELYVYYIVPYEGGWGNFDDGGFEYLTCGEYADYSLSMKYKGVLMNPAGDLSAQLGVAIGAQASKAEFAVSDLDPQSILGAMLQGSIETVTVDATATEVSLPIAGSGSYYAVGVTYKGDEPMQAMYVAFEVEGFGGSAAWTNVCLADIVDGWILPAFTITSTDGDEIPYTELAWQVQAQESTETPGLYRLRNVYTSEDYVLTYLKANQNSTATDWIIDATNKDCVKIMPQYSGFTYGGDDFYIADADGYFAQQGMDDASIIELGMATVWDNGYLEIFPALHGNSIDDCQYSWKSEPTAEIYFDLAGAGAPAKMKGRFTSARNAASFDYHRLEASINSHFRIPAVRQTKRNLSSNGFNVVAKPFRIKK